ncbi:MAG: hypothetical protein WAO07_20465, partial [Desulfobacterales bacterium]
MKRKSLNTLAVVLISVFATVAVHAKSDMSPEEIRTKAASIPDKVQTVAGELEFFDGVPVGNTTELVYDYLDRA